MSTQVKLGFLTTGIVIVSLLTGQSEVIAAGRPETDAVQEMQSGDLAQCQAAAAAILKQRRETIEALIQLCDGKQNTTTRAAAMYSLGKMRAAEACSVLVANISFATCQEWFGKPSPDIVNAFGVHPARAALIEIGKPSVPFLLGEIKNSNDRGVRMGARIAIRHIEGLRQTRQLLNDALQEEKDEQVRERLAAALKIIENQIRARQGSPEDK